ncbi:hypothetical protein [Alloactinosynnema sp. L-07]|uniref:hypothetical protein n=1 Tax=Alloactinosynnema sp. L-07 TaxID=1653480 RepID=UPI00065EF298|nr:hypothetical protein [Alloactinosynnema sp. L-07]CRK60173.1 hypothetical protein [Alloactinosynnema sp. L-07]
MDETWKSERLLAAEAQLDAALASLAAAEAKVAEAGATSDTTEPDTRHRDDDDESGYTVRRHDAW